MLFMFGAYKNIFHFIGVEQDLVSFRYWDLNTCIQFKQQNAINILLTY